MGGYVIACIGRYVGMFVNNFLAPVKSSCHKTSSVRPLATGDEVIKFWKVKVGGGGMHYALFMHTLLVLASYRKDIKISWFPIVIFIHAHLQ